MAEEMKELRLMIEMQQRSSTMANLAMAPQPVLQSPPEFTNPPTTTPMAISAPPGFDQMPPPRPNYTPGGGGGGEYNSGSNNNNNWTPISSTSTFLGNGSNNPPPQTQQSHYGPSSSSSGKPLSSSLSLYGPSSSSGGNHYGPSSSSSSLSTKPTAPSPRARARLEDLKDHMTNGLESQYPDISVIFKRGSKVTSTSGNGIKPSRGPPRSGERKRGTKRRTDYICVGNEKLHALVPSYKTHPPPNHRNDSREPGLIEQG